MEGVTTAIVAFLFVCIVFPRIIKNKPQYYAAFGAILMVIFFDGSRSVITAAGYIAFTTFMICILQVMAMILLVLSAGGLHWRELAGEVSEAIEVMRRGDVQKEVIIPLRGDEQFLKVKTGGGASSAVPPTASMAPAAATGASATTSPGAAAPIALVPLTGPTAVPPSNAAPSITAPFMGSPRGPAGAPPAGEQR